MAKYIVHRTVHYIAEVEADGVYDALVKASNLDDSEFSAVDEDEMTAELNDEDE